MQIPDTYGTSLQTVIAWLVRLVRILNGQLSLGSPGNGPDNISGNWVTVSFTATDTATLVNHNLGQPVVGGAPNVCWLVGRMKHDGTGVNAASTLSVDYDTRDVAQITTNAMPLRLYADGGRTVSVSHPVTVDFFVIVALN